jgi:hypothetical protein
MCAANREWFVPPPTAAELADDAAAVEREAQEGGDGGGATRGPVQVPWGSAGLMGLHMFIVRARVHAYA